MKRLAAIFAALLAAWNLLVAFEHVVYDAVSLNGDWEMAYIPYACESVKPPVFAGVIVDTQLFWHERALIFISCQFPFAGVYSV